MFGGPEPPCSQRSQGGTSRQLAQGPCRKNKPCREPEDKREGERRRKTCAVILKSVFPIADLCQRRLRGPVSHTHRVLTLVASPQQKAAGGEIRGLGLGVILPFIPSSCILAVPGLGHSVPALHSSQASGALNTIKCHRLWSMGKGIAVESQSRNSLRRGSLQPGF